jgi:hypothetical protein
MSARPRRYLPLLRLRRLRAGQAERAWRAAADAIEEGQREYDRAREIESVWRAASRTLDEWLGSIGPGERVRWTAVAHARRTDIVRSVREARDYVGWWETEMERLRQALTLARAGWRREQARLDVLGQRYVSERRSAADRDEDALYQERADAAAGSRATGGVR